MINRIENYLQSNIFKPFFIVAGDTTYTQLKNELLEKYSIEVKNISDLCLSQDKKPDLDRLRDLLREADVSCESNKLLILGLGEYLALEGEKYAKDTLQEFIRFNLGSAHAIFLLRGVDSQVKALSKEDIRFQRQIAFCDDTECSLQFVFGLPDLMLFDNTGIKEALRMSEEGSLKKICVNTSIVFPNSLLSVQVLKNPYEALRKRCPEFALPKYLGDDDQWDKLLGDVTALGGLQHLFQLHHFDNTLENFHELISGSEYINWLYYIYIVSNVDSFNNKYLSYVVGLGGTHEEFKVNILNAISLVPHESAGFADLYIDRKKLVKAYSEPEIAMFVSNNRVNPDESIYKLTDNTQVEREEIIAEIAQHGMPENIDAIYPRLAMYLKEYRFKDDALSALLTDYFTQYKYQKVFNKLDDEFINKVDELAANREYNRLRHRDEIIAGIETGSTFLCWIDALGVEYLSYIVELAKQHGLSISVDVGRSNLPTITSLNKSFYEKWPDDLKRKVEDLDDTKHTEKGGYKYGPSNKYAIHLSKELDVIEDVINEAATGLALHTYDKYVIASDHGASRLAVLRKKEEKYESDTQGEHSGRCCKVFPGYDLEFATEENGYIVLADYGRFKGSRAANVEVHGGASLEEVLVPVITLSLRDNSIEIKVVEEIIKADYKTGVTFTLFVNKPISQIISVEYEGKRFAGSKTDDSHYTVTIDSIKKACVVPADIYLGEDLVSQITMKVVGKSASVNNDFDDLF